MSEIQLSDFLIAPPAASIQRLCQRNPETGRCTQCKRLRDEGVIIECPAHPNTPASALARQAPAKLGDMTEAFFKSLGITEDRYKAAKESLHLDPSCNCRQRKEWLNKMGDELGVTNVAAKLAGWWKGQKSDAPAEKPGEDRRG